MVLSLAGRENANCAHHACWRSQTQAPKPASWAALAASRITTGIELGPVEQMKARLRRPCPSAFSTPVLTAAWRRSSGLDGERERRPPSYSGVERGSLATSRGYRCRCGAARASCRAAESSFGCGRRRGRRGHADREGGGRGLQEQPPRATCWPSCGESRTQRR